MQQGSLKPTTVPSAVPGAGIIERGRFTQKIRHIDVRHIEKPADISQDIAERLRTSWIGRFYRNRLKHHPSVRWIVIQLWRYLIPLYLNLKANIAIYVFDRKATKWRVLIKQSKIVKEKGVSAVKLVDSTLAETPTPSVFPTADQECVLPKSDHYRFPEVFVASLNNGLVYGGTNLILVDNTVICHDLYDFERDYTSEELHGRTLIDARSNRIRWLLHDREPEHVPVAAAFVDACALNYAHWLTEVLPRIAVFCAETEFNHVPIVVNEGLHKNIMESLFLVAGQEREIFMLPIGRALRVDSLYLTSVAGYVPFDRRNKNLRGHSHGIFNPRLFELVRNQIISYVQNLPEQPFPQRIYIRRNSGIRKITNSAEIEEILFDRGFVAVEPEKLTFLQQVQLFMNASEIISPTGAALSNAIFSRPGTRVGVLMGKHPNMIYKYWLNMLSPLKIHLSYVLGDIVNNQYIGIHGDPYVDSRNVLELLGEWQVN